MLSAAQSVYYKQIFLQKKCQHPANVFSSLHSLHPSSSCTHPVHSFSDEVHGKWSLVRFRDERVIMQNKLVLGAASYPELRGSQRTVSGLFVVLVS